MKIAYITAGAAGMLCGSCIHDNTLAAAMMKQGHDVALMATYTPIRTDETNVSIDRVFFGGVNVYLQQKSSLFRRAPRFVDWFFDRPAALNWVSRFSSSTNARDLGALTVSVLRGERGHQRKELAKLVEWLRNDYKPDIVLLTNSMFAGFARDIKRETGVPVICAVQGEDIFLEDLIEPYRSQARALVRERAQDADAFIAPSAYYVNHMADYMAIPRERFHVVPLGLNVEGYTGEADGRGDNPFTVAYVARMCPEKGFHLLVDAFIRLSERAGAGNVRLAALGYLGKKDGRYLRENVERIEHAGLAGAFRYHGEATREEKARLLASAHALCVPTVYREPKGLFVLEALANGTPVILPRHGSFPEMIEATGGGLLVAPNSAEAVADGIVQLMEDAPLREKLGRQGREAVRAQFTDETMATRTIEVFHRYTTGG